MPVEKSAIHRILERMRREQQQRQQPEKSHFEKPEPDRDQERRQAEAKRAEAARQSTARLADQHALTDKQAFARESFKRVTLEHGARQQREIEQKFTHDETRSAAFQVMIDAAEARDAADDAIHERLARVSAAIDRMDLARPVPEDYARDLNRQIREAQESHRYSVEDIRQRVERALGKILEIDKEMTLARAPLLITHEVPQIEDQHVTYVPPGGLNREAYSPWDVGQQFADAAEAEAVEAAQEKPEWFAVFEATARPAQPSTSPNFEGQSPGM